MSQITLTYFDMHGGRGEAARLALFIGGIAFEDRRIPFADWPRVKPDMPFGAIPVLEVDGETVTQSNGINRYVGKLAKLYPDDPWQAALCDEAMDVIEDMTNPVVATFSIRDEAEKKARRQALADGPLSFHLRRLEKRLAARGGTYFADSRLTVADLKIFVWIRHLRSGNLDHIPTDLTDRVAPLLVSHSEAIANHPKIKAYYER